MKTKTTVILLIIALALGLFIFLVERKIPTTEEQAKLGKKLFRVESDQISRIELTRDKEKIICQRKPQSDEWEMTAPLQTRADISAIEQVLRELEFAEKKGSLKPEPDKSLDLTSFGLVTPRLEMSFTIGEENITHQFKIGNETKLGNAYYLTLEGKDEVYLVDKSFYETLNKSAYDFRYKKVTDLSAGQTNKLQFVSASGGLIELTKLDINKWQVTKPITDRASSDKIRDILSAIDELSARAFVADNETDLVKYGLDLPRLEITVFTPARQETILWGNTLPDDSTKVYATQQGTNTIISLDSSSFDELNVVLKDLRERKLFDLSLDKIISIELTYQDRAGIQIRKEGGTWQMIKPGGVDFDTSTLYGFITEFNDTTIEEFVADSPTDLAPYGLLSPTIEASFIFPASPNAFGGSGKEPQLKIALAPFTDTSHTYLKTSDEPRVVAVANDLYDTLKKGSLIFRRKSLLNIPRHKITRCTVEKNGVKTIFEQEKPGIWNVIAPEETKLDDTSKLYETLDTICYLGTSEFIAENPSDLTIYGLDKPSYRIEIEYQEDSELERKVVLVGKKAEQDFYYGMIEGQPLIFLIASDLVSKLKGDILKDD